MIAGGASLAPRRWSWPGEAIDARSSAWCLLTAWMTAAQKNRKRWFSCGDDARLEQVGARVGAHRPVVVLAGAVDAGERLLVQQADEPVAAGDVLHDLHRQLLVVGADVRVLEDRRDLVLRRRDLVVAGLDRHAELRQLALGLEHVREHALGDRAEVVVVELVALRRLGAEQRAAGVDEVGALEVELLVDQEVLLLRPDGGEHARDVAVAEQAQRAHRRVRQRVHRAQQRDLVVERLARPRRERGRDAEQRAVRVLEDEGRRGRVPGRVAAGLERGPDAAGRERRRIGLALDQLLAGELGDRRAVAGRAVERVVLLRGRAGQRLEPVGEVGRALLHRPLLHRGRRRRRRGSGRAGGPRRASPGGA